MGKLKIIAVTYNQTTELEVFIGSLLLQSCSDWELDLWYDGPVPSDVLDVVSRHSDSRITLKTTDKRNGKWGHISRKIALERLRGNTVCDFVLITNGDNYYVPGFVRQMLDGCNSRENVGVVYCDTIHSHLNWDYHKSILVEGGLDMGCCIVRMDIAKAVGFQWEHFAADGKYLEECGKIAAIRGLCAVHIARGLFIHN